MKPDVIAERLNNLIEMVTEFKQENYDDHKDIMKKQDYTNGTVARHTDEINDIKTCDAVTMAYLKGMLRVFVAVAIITPCVVSVIFSLYIYYIRSEITKEIQSTVSREIDNNNKLQFTEYIK